MAQVLAACDNDILLKRRRRYHHDRDGERDPARAGRGLTVAPAVTGIVGLGNMEAVLAANLVASGHAVVAHDVAGPGRSPEGAAFVPDVATVARRADVVVLSLPDGPVTEQVARQIAATAERRVTHVVDTSTVGVAAARAIDAVLAGTGAGIAYVDAPVSGGVAGAQARTLMVMYAGSDAACAAVEPLLAALSDRWRRVGDRPVGRARPGHHARGPGRVERPELGDHRQVPRPRPDRPLRVRLRQLADGQGPAALPLPQPPWRTEAWQEPPTSRGSPPSRRPSGRRR
ncbi:MAG TPA: NAD(P)-binding domain-containing protein [Acidimicrobiales bacterium]|nr:NAD(P)-binding domain-containing protein [Acidimicrobiales bacterium]